MSEANKQTLAWAVLSAGYFVLFFVTSLLVPHDILERHGWARVFVDFMSGWNPHIKRLGEAQILTTDSLRFYYSVLWASTPFLVIAGWLSFEPGSFVERHRQGRFGPFAYKLLLGLGSFFLLYWYLLAHPLGLERSDKYWRLNENAALRGLWGPILVFGVAIYASTALRAIADFAGPRARNQ